MSRLLEEPEPNLTTGGTPAADLRFCTHCRQQFVEGQVTWVDGHWSCNRCYEAHVAANPIEPPELDDECDAMAPLAEIAQVDRTLRYCGVAGRYGSYGMLAFLATEYEPISHMMHGVVVADVAVWVGTAWFDFKLNRLPVLIELVGFVLLTHVLLYTDMIQQPADPASFGLAFLAFTLFFTVKGSLSLLSRMRGHHEEA